MGGDADRRFGEDLLATRLVELAFPGPLRRPIPLEKVAAAGRPSAALSAGPAALSFRLAGPAACAARAVNPLIDRDLERRPEFRDLVREMENRVTGS